MQLRVVLGSLLLAGTVHADPGPADTVGISDDLITTPGLRPIGGPRVEALVSTGSYGTHRAAARASSSSGSVGLEVDGSVLDSDGYVPVAPEDRGTADRGAARSERETGARLDHERGASAARLWGRWSRDQRDAGIAHQNTDLTTARVGGRWTRSGSALHVDAHAFHQSQRLREERPRIASDRSSALQASEHAVPVTVQGVRGTAKSRRVHAFGVAHELAIGGGVLLAAGEQHEELTPSLDQSHMSTVVRRMRGQHRFLDAYIEDTVRFIRGLDVTGGLVIERWANLGGDSSIAYGLGDPMEVAIPDVTSLLVSPSLGVRLELDDGIALRARSHRRLRTPTMDELYRSVLVGDEMTAANPQLRPETVRTSELGPELSRGRVTARASLFHSSIDRAIGSVTIDDGVRQRMNLGAARVVGVDSEITLRPARAWLATVTYTFAASRVTEAPLYPGLAGAQLAQMPRQQAGALLTFDDPAIATLTGAVRYVGASYEDERNTRRLGGFAVVDAVAARKIAGGLTGFVAVENLLDRRYAIGRTGVETLGAPRMFQLGLRIDSQRF